MNKISSKLIALVLSAAMVTGLVYAYDGIVSKSETTDTTAAVTEETAETSEDTADQVKDETVYVLTGADGTVNKIIVSDWIKNQIASGSIPDETELTDIKNVKGDESYTLGGDNTCVWDANGNDIYYQGNIDKELPVSMNVSYTLDGAAISAEELAGKSGQVTITYNFTNNQYETVEIDGQEEKIYVPFLMLTGMILNNDSFKNITVTNGKIINDGNHTIVAGFAMPGLQEDLGLSEDVISIPNSITVTADVTDFSLGITVTLATNEIFANEAFDEVEDFDLSELTDALSEDGEIGSAVQQVLDGSSALYDGLCTLLEKSDELVDGVNKLAAGAKSLKEGADQLSSGADTLATGTESLESGAKSANDGAAALSSGASQVADGASQVADGAASLKDGAAQLSSGATQVADGASQLASGAKSLSDGLATLESNNDSLNAGAKKVFETLLATARTQIQAAGITCPELTIDNYSKTLDTIISSLDSNKVYSQALATVTAAVNAQKSTVEAGVNAAVKQQVTAAVIQNALSMDTDTYTAAVASGAISETVQQQINAAVTQQMESDTIKAKISAATDAKIQELIDQNMQSDTVQAKLTAASEGVQSLTALKASLNEYNTFYTGLGQYTAGVATAADGAKDLASGASTLATGASSLETGAASLETGAGTLSDGAASLETGASDLSDGAKTLADGTQALYDGTKQVNSGAGDLSDGAKSLAEGANTLYDGILTLKDGMPALITGITELRDGSEQLADGLGEFYDEAMEVWETYEGDINVLTARVKAIIDVARDYKSFSGITDAMDGEVRFIYRTAEISSEQ